MTEPLQPARPLTRAEVRDVDRKAIEEFGVPGVVLMENAGLGLTEAVLDHLGGRREVGIVVGRGNNGGDGLVLARHMQLRGRTAWIAYCGRTAEADRSTDAGINLTIVERSGIPLFETPDPSDLADLLSEHSHAALLVDALYGTGLASELRPNGRALVEVLDAALPPKLAVDIPSGLDCDRGVPLGAAVRAERTVTFVARKVGFDVEGASAYTGRVQVVSIGCPPQAWRP